jgi:hypothetical protein
VTHPFHPLLGRTFELLTYRKTWGEDRVFFYEGGRLRAMPASWTDAAPAAPFVSIAAGRAYFRPEDLLHLVELVEAQRGERSDAPGVSSKLRRQCKDKSAANGGGSRKRKR